MKQTTTILLLFFNSHYCLLTNNNACKSYIDYWIKDVSPNCFHNPDVGKNTPEILQNHFERYENHTVSTEDGYILHIFRIPKENPKGVVILQHPLATDAIVWVAQNNESQALLFWNEGYDVWLPNQRGTFFSDKHINLTTNDFEFWNFTYHEIGIYDYSSIIRYISNVTNNQELIFIGHSQATTASIIYASLKPDEAKKYVKIFIEMSPVTALKYTRNPLRYFAFLKTPVTKLTNFLKIGAVARYNSLSGFLFRLPLHFPFKFPVIVFFSFVTGWTPNEFDPKWYSAVFTQLPRGLSIKLFANYYQYVNGAFNQYDYGKKENLLRYNSEVPPEYPVGNIVVPVYLVASKDDAVGTVKDAEVLYNKLSDPAKIYGKLIISGINHLDFQFGKHRKQYVYEPILNLLEKI